MGDKKKKKMPLLVCLNACGVLRAAYCVLLGALAVVEWMVVLLIV